MLSAKNAMLSTASADLGLGDQLQSQVQADIDERRKKLAKLGQMAQLPGLGPATQSLLNPMGNQYG